MSDVILEQNHGKDKRQKFNIIGDSLLNNINRHGLSKSKKVSVSNFALVTNEDRLEEIQNTLKLYTDTLIVDAGTKDLTKNMNTLMDVKKLSEKTKKGSFFRYNLSERKTKYR